MGTTASVGPVQALNVNPRMQRRDLKRRHLDRHALYGPTVPVVSVARHHPFIRIAKVAGIAPCAAQESLDGALAAILTPPLPFPPPR